MVDKNGLNTVDTAEELSGGLDDMLGTASQNTEGYLEEEIYEPEPKGQVSNILDAQFEDRYDGKSEEELSYEQKHIEFSEDELKALEGLDFSIPNDAGSLVDSADSAEDRLRELSDKLVSSCIGDKGIRSYSTERLLSASSPRLFRDENYVIFSIFNNFRGRLRYINIDEEFVRLYLMRNQDLITKARQYIDISAYDEVEGSQELGYIAGVCKHFRRLEGLPEPTAEEFETTFEKYLIEFKAIESLKAYRTAQKILTEGASVGRKKLFGFVDSSSFIKQKLAEIEGLVDAKMGTGFTDMVEILQEEKEETKKPTKVSDFGAIRTLNKVYGGIYTGMFYSVLAPAKSGKSKLCARIAHTTSVQYGNNVSVWAIEGGSTAFTAQMRAIHFDYTYNTGVAVQDMKFGVSQDVILKNSFMSDDLRQLESSSRLDLISNSNYGRVQYIDRPFNVETFIEDIDTSITSNNSKLLIIDYLQLIGSTGRYDERERIAEAYRRLLEYCKNKNIAVFVPAQYKQEAINSLLSKADVSTSDLRTAAGGSAEVTRTPDILIGLWGSSSDLMNNRLKIISMPSRFASNFPMITLTVDFATCRFIEQGYDNGE